MFIVRASHPRNGVIEVDPQGPVCLLGKGERSHLRLEGWNIAKEHARITLRDGGLYVEALGSLGVVLVNGEKLREYGPIQPEDDIQIAGYRLHIISKTKGTADGERRAEESLPIVPAITLESSPTAPAPTVSPQTLIPAPYRDERWQPLLREAQERLRAQMDLRRLDLASMQAQELRRVVGQLVEEVIRTMRSPADVDQQRLAKEVLDEAVGLGPLEDLLADETITEIMVNRFDEVFIERRGRLEPAPATFSSESAVRHIIDRIVAPVGRRIDESSPLVDARLADGSRVNAVIPPVALKGAGITIRKFAKKRLQIEDLMAFGSIEERMSRFLNICVEQRKNIVISGGTGSGKTTLLNVLSNFIPDHERIVTIEDAAELRLYQPNLVSMEARPANIEGRGQIPIRELVRNALRMRPDRIVVGECRGGEALDMLQAMNTGHDGSLTTAHANAPRDMLSRLEVMVMMAGMELPLTAIREQIASAVDIIVQITRFSCGSRKVTNICEITGTESGVIQLQELFVFKQQGYDANGKVRGVFLATGAVPEFFEDMRARGLPVDLNLFREAADE